MKSKLLTLALSGLFSLGALAAPSIAIVDLAEVFESVPQGVTAFNAMKEQLSPEVTQLQTQQKSLQSQLDALNKDSSMSKARLTREKAALDQQAKALQAKVQTFQNQAAKQEQALLADFGKNVKTAVAQIAREQGDEIVLSSQSALYTADSANITKQVIDMLQKEAPQAAS